MPKTKSDYQQYIQSPWWQERRRTAIAEADHKCENCELPRWLAALVYNQDLHVHHRSYANLGREQYEDLRVLCRRCHDIETFGRSDFPEIKTAKCRYCGSEHYNVYADYCPTCGLFLQIPEPIYFAYFNKDDRGEPFWRIALKDLMRFMKGNVTHAELCEAIRTIKN